MWWLYVLLAIIVLLFLILNIRLRFLVGYDEKPSVILKVLFFKLDILNRKKKKKVSEKEQAKKEKKKKPKENTEKDEKFAHYGKRNREFVRRQGRLLGCRYWHGWNYLWNW